MTATPSVLIVGGGLNGLATALFLAHRGVPCLVAERRSDTCVQYRFRGLSPRSMEIFRSAGMEDAIRAHRTGDQRSGGLARVRTLADPDVAWQRIPWAETGDISPVEAETCDQDVLEPLLRKRAELLGADIRFGTDVTSVSQDARGVTARIRDTRTGRAETVTAAYLVAADGAHGTTRSGLGIGRHGPGVLQHWMNVVFDTDLSPLLQGRRCTSVHVTGIGGSLVPRDGTGRWLLALPYAPPRGEQDRDRDERFTPERLRALIREAAGDPHARADIVDARPWQVAAYVADRYRAGRAFLVGDTAHVMPPTGAFGGNTGLHDAYNLAWKLAAVLEGSAGEALLDSYDTERRPVAERTLRQALARLGTWFPDPEGALPPADPLVDDEAVIFGYRYEAGALVPEGEPDPEGAVFEDPRRPSGRPGTRAPHVPLHTADGPRSTLDLLGRGFVLLTGDGPRSADWHTTGLPTECRTAGGERWESAYGVGADGAVLVRPDGHIAWRAPGIPAQGATAALRRALTTVLSWTSAPSAV
ncbi:FAD-dependent monooxygenase [Streptomyces boncukensis]|uniref:FAD-binding domain-containing protein n=1 Tax=Streptomyces boncukensis TaxID=2711219 RepID=A0A6G4X800_9ACTN|nr:FAD-dependent monooxygenase [Streptomyces boncukensis]NGO72874.1 hypothetical protein [Streptomyces boncukensis]